MAVAVSAEQQADTFVRSPHGLLIDGDWVEAASGSTLQTLNPATEEVLAGERPQRATSGQRKWMAEHPRWPSSSCVAAHFGSWSCALQEAACRSAT